VCVITFTGGDWNFKILGRDAADVDQRDDAQINEELPDHD